MVGILKVILTFAHEHNIKCDYYSFNSHIYKLKNIKHYE